MIRLGSPAIGEAETAAATAALLSGRLVQGPCVAEFEGKLADLLRVPHVAAVSNGTAALHLALLALDIGRGDKVAVTTFSWPATANVIELCGATPVFVDIEETTYGMGADQLERTLATNADVRAVMPVHAFGGMADMPRLRTVADDYGLPIVEDAACALGASLHGTSAGCFGRMGCFSFHPRKAATTGEGGAVVMDDPDLLRRVRILRNHGIDPTAPDVDFVEPGFNYRLSEMQAAVGVAQLKRLPEFIQARRALAAAYDALLAKLPLPVPRFITPESHVYQSYIVLLPEDMAERRADVIKQMYSAGIETTIGTYHMPLLSYYRKTYGFKPGDHPVSESVAARSLALPIHSNMTVEDAGTVVEALERLL